MVTILDLYRTGAVSVLDLLGIIFSALIFLVAVIAIARTAAPFFSAIVGTSHRTSAIVVGVGIYVVRAICNLIFSRFGGEDVYAQFSQIFFYTVVGVGGFIILVGALRAVLKLLFGK